MPRRVRARLDEPSGQGLALLREAKIAADDPDDLAEALRVRREMDAIAAAWAVTRL